jgi:hypothetical protein
MEGTSSAGVGFTPHTQSVVNGCIPAPLLCTTNPTSAQDFDLSTQVSASTDGNGHSAVSFSSADNFGVADAETIERGNFHTDGDVGVHLSAFFPSIVMMGVFSDQFSFVSYQIAVKAPSGSTETNAATLFASGYTGATADFDARHHTVTILPFFLDFDLGTVFGSGTPGGLDFQVEVDKRLLFEGHGAVEIASGEILDPNQASMSLRESLVFTDVTASAPDPPTWILMGTAIFLLPVLAGAGVRPKVLYHLGNARFFDAGEFETSKVYQDAHGRAA